jgi:hypothetical protein
MPRLLELLLGLAGLIALLIAAVPIGGLALIAADCWFKTRRRNTDD